MLNNFNLEHIYIVLIVSGIFTWGMTFLGAAIVLFFKNIKQIYLDGMLGFAAGVMISASFTSLILPAIDYAKANYESSLGILTVAIGIMLGVVILMLLDKVLPHLHPFEDVVEGPKTSLQRSILLIFAITLHNIPEGLAVGVSYGAAYLTQDPFLFAGAVSLTIGIGIQNFPEGGAVAFPLYREGYSKFKSFFWGQLSAIVEPIMIFVGFFLVTVINKVLPLFLGLAAGAMLFVVIEELIPESQASKNIHAVTLFTVIGLVVMLFLDVLLG